MSNTKIFVMRNLLAVSLFVDGVQKQFHFETEEQSMAFFKEVSDLRAAAIAGDSDAHDKITAMISVSHRFDEVGGLTRDSNGAVYLGEFSEPIPTGLKRKIREYVDNNLPVESLANFWKLLMLNPDKHVRRSLFQFAERFNFPITDKGYFIAYKSVAWKGISDAGRAKMISAAYLKAKAEGSDVARKIVIAFPEDNDYFYDKFDIIDIEDNDILKVLKGSKLSNEQLLLEASRLLTDHYSEVKRKYIEVVDFVMMKDTEKLLVEKEEDSGHLFIDEAVTIDVQAIGYLEQEFHNLQKVGEFEVPTFTDFYTQKSTITLGAAVKMEREDCDNNPNNTCSSGLHVGAPGYVKSFGASSKQYVLACLVSPMNVVAVPDDYNYEKMRTCEYLPYAICEIKDNAIVEVDSRYFEEDYSAIEAKDLTAKLEELYSKHKDGKVSAEVLAETQKLIQDRLVVLDI